LKIAAALAMTMLMGAVFAGCMGRTTSHGSGQARPAIPPRTYLYIAVWPTGRDGKGHRYGLRCRGPGGEYSSGAARAITAPRACLRLVRLGVRAFAPVPANAACTQIYGGPAEAHVSGLIGGRPVDAGFNRGDGCEIARWNKIRFLLPGVSSVS
jgi:hypothetical protein